MEVRSVGRRVSGCSDKTDYLPAFYFVAFFDTGFVAFQVRIVINVLACWVYLVNCVSAKFAEK